MSITPTKSIQRRLVAFNLGSIGCKVTSELRSSSCLLYKTKYD